MKKILIVEDEISFFKILSSQLTNQGYLVIKAANGKEGLKQIKNENPDLVLLDIRMPVMNGMVMLNLLRQDKIGKKTKVIILTNIELDNKLIGKIIKNKPICYLIKSDTKLNDLFKKIKKLLI